MTLCRRGPDQRSLAFKLAAQRRSPVHVELYVINDGTRYLYSTYTTQRDEADNTKARECAAYMLS